MEIALVILVVLAIVAVAVVLRKRKAQEEERLDDAAAPARPARSATAAPDPAGNDPLAAKDRRPAEVLREPVHPSPLARTPEPAPAEPASAEPAPAEAAPAEPVEAEGQPASPPPAPVRTPATPPAADAGPTAETPSLAPEFEDETDSRKDATAQDEPLAPRPSARVEAKAEAVPSPVAPARTGNWLSLRKGLAKSRESTGFFGRIKQLLGGRRELDPSIAERLEEILLSSDVGMATTERMLARLKEGISRGDLADEARVFDALRVEAERTLTVDGFGGAIRTPHQPTVVLFVGVNGAGKTTTIGKLAQNLTSQGKKVMLAAGDTFRAAAVDQLKVWGRRVNCEVVTGKEGADPSSVLFDAIQAAKSARVDVLLADTAGRLHTKANLMQEMTKVQKVAAKALEGAPHETLLVIDATNGQNALAQAREFKEALPITGLVLTKLDGTAKGGVVLGICDALRIPVRYVGVGERAEDLHEFDPSAFVEALLGAENEVIAA
jgi:fused signal recognition particle receptor